MLAVGHKMAALMCVVIGLWMGALWLRSGCKAGEWGDKVPYMFGDDDTFRVLDGKRK